MLRFARTHPRHHQDHAQVATVPEESCAPARHATPKSILKRTNEIASKPATEPPPPRPKTLANKNRNSNTTNNIRFFDQAQLIFIPHVDDYTEDEKQNYWFEANEYAQIKENNKMLLDIIQSGPYSIEYYENHDDVYCLRGLESKAASLSNSPSHRLGRKRSSSRRRINRSGAAAAVFAEQHRQHQERHQQPQQQQQHRQTKAHNESGSKISDWDRIRDAYVDVTARCHNEAHTQGLRDAEKASQYLSSQEP